MPIQTENGSIGFIAVFSRSRSHSWDDDEVRELEELALRAGPAIENAKRFREARQLADLDALTGLHNRRYFHETLSREVARAQRYDSNSPWSSSISTTSRRSTTGSDISRATP